MEKSNLIDKLSQFHSHWQPHIIGSYNNNDLMVVKVQGTFNWHSHPNTDDLFLCLKGTVDIELRNQTITLNAGELFVVPAGIEHRPIAQEEAHLLLIEPRGTPNTGNAQTAVHKPML